MNQAQFNYGKSKEGRVNNTTVFIWYTIPGSAQMSKTSMKSKKNERRNIRTVSKVKRILK